MTTATHNDRHVVLGKIQGLFGVKGWVKVFSHTEPRENILQYSPWFLRRGKDVQELKVVEGKPQGKTVVARLEGIDDRETAAKWVNAEIFVPRDVLPELDGEEYYWTDLEGLRVVNRDKEDLGVVDHLIATGANDVLVVKGKEEILVPFLRDTVIRDVNLEQGVIEVDWEPGDGA